MIKKIFLLLIFVSFSRADFEDIGIGARPIGFAAAFTALADDPNTIFYNPAGLLQLKKIGFSFEQANLYWGLDDNEIPSITSFALALPIGSKYGSFGLGFTNFGLLSYYNETTFILSYSYDISEVLKKPLFIGLNLKLLHKKYGTDKYTLNAVDDSLQATGEPDPLFENGNSKSGFTFDLGALYKIKEKYSFGFSMFNISQPGMDLKADTRVPLSLKAGFAYCGSATNCAVELSYRRKDVGLGIGAEKWFFDKRYGLRGGLSIATRACYNINFGFSYVPRSFFQIDYAFTFPLGGIADTLGSHRFSLNLTF